MTSSFQVRILILLRVVGYLFLNELGEKSHATIILGKFVNKPYSNSHWLIVGQNFHWSKFKTSSHDILLLNC